MTTIARMIEMARGHVEAGETNQAGTYYRMVLTDTSPPKSGLERVAHGEACIWYARKSLAEGRVGTATDWYQQALAADPLAVDYRVEYCVKALIPMGAHKNARIEAERATRIEPESKNAWRTLGGVEHILGNVAASVAAYDRQIEIAPDDHGARLDRATIALDTADYDTVRAMIDPILRTGGERLGDALHVAAMVAYREGRHADAVGLYDSAIGMNCYDPELATWNKSLALHSIGRYREGWAAHEARGKQKTDQAMALLMKRFTKPLWAGEPAPARLHVHQEMGHGDVIAMARYIPILIERGYEVCVEVMDSMVGLLARSFPRAKVIPKAIDYPGAMGVPMFDYHIPMLSLPAMFGTDIDTVPWRGPYLKPDPKLAREYRARLEAIPFAHQAKRRIGLCWSSGIRNDGLWISEYGRRKSMMFNRLRPLFADAFDVMFVSLQVGPESKERRDPVVELLPAKPTWDETAALVDCLDVVVTVDTSVAHLAGALGKPVLLMMHTEGSWHWMTERTDSPWYPTARVYRQQTPHEWGDVIKRIAADLRPDEAARHDHPSRERAS